MMRESASLGVAMAVVVIAGLNFLRVGIHPPTPTWDR
jgi:ABC-type dipeptide/oligopeptide/nickel transport system permease subunit